jgi:hypothetical protein
MRNIDNYIAEIDTRISALANKYGIDFSTNSTYVNNKPTIILTEQERRNVKIAGIINSTSDEDMLSDYLEFLQPDMTGGYQAPAIGLLNDNPEQILQKKNIKQASVSKPEDILNTFREFGGF